MREHPPQELVDLLAKLGLARAEQVRGVRSRVRRLARDLPGFESVWVDALAQARVLTPFQAAEINAGRGAALEVGPYVLHQPLPSPGYASVYRAVERKSRRWVRLSIIATPVDKVTQLSARLKTLVHLSSALPTTNGLLPVFAHGAAGNSVWVASHDVRGQTAADWMVHHGRFPPAAVLEIAQQMLAALLVCEQAELVHGDLRPGQVLLDSHGKVWLPEPGLRLAVRPDEGFGHADLPPEAYECLAPERVAVGGAPDTAGDLYACGCLWWHLLAGRPAIAGATSLAKLRAGQTAKIAEVRQLAPEAPAALAETIADCLRRDPRSRPDSIGRVAVRLATHSPSARRQLLRSVRRSSSSFRRSASMASAARRTAARVTRLAAAAGAIAAVVVGTWPYWGAEWTNRSNPQRRDPSDRGASMAGRGPNPLPTGEISALAPQTGKQSISEADNRHEVLPASWEEPLTNVLELDPEKLQQLADLSLTPGMTVRGRMGKRAMIRVPRGGLVMDVEDIHFENLDFIGGAAMKSGRDQPDAMVVLRAWRAKFLNCSFQSAGAARLTSGRMPAAIAWLGLPSADDELSLPTGEISLDHCVFSGLSAALYCDIQAALVFELTHSLHLGPGPLVMLADAPQADEPITLVMNHLTLRNASCLLECRYDELAEASANINVQADDCAFVPSSGGGLLAFKGAAHPGQLLEHLNWSGQGSVLARESPLALWHGSNGKIRTAAEETIQVAGMVRTEVGFAGEADEGPGASRIVRWQVPLRSTEPPGIGEDELSLPNIERK